MTYKTAEERAAYARAWRAKNRVRAQEIDAAKRAKKKQEDPGWAYRKTKAWRAANPEKLGDQNDRYNERQKERRLADPVFKKTLRGYQAKYLAKPGVRERRNQYTKEWHKARRAENPEHYRASVLKHTYGLTIEQYDAMVLAQEGKCAICRVDRPGGNGKRWHIDHCHDSNRIRELLCHSCNTGLGAFKDKPDLLRAAVAYLEKHQP